MSKTVAILNNENIVINIVIVNDDYELNLNEVFYTDQNPAFIDGDYVNGYFYPSQPFTSWTRDGQGRWLPPTTRPTEGRWRWDEENLMWQQLES